MAGGQQGLGPAGHVVGAGAGLVKQIDFHQAFPVKQAQGLGGRHIDGIVQIKTQHLTLGLHHAGNAVALGADAHPLAQGVAQAEQLVFDLAAQHHKGPGRPLVIGRQEAAGRHPHLPHLGGVRPHTEDIRAPLP
jgi:hypothetical protein